MKKLLSLFKSGPKQHETKAESALTSAVINPRYYKAQQQVIAQYLNAYVRYMFDSVNLAKELGRVNTDGTNQMADALRLTITTEELHYNDAESEFSKVMNAKLKEKAELACNEARGEAKRKAHQFSQLSQSVLRDQRNNLLLSKTILMAQQYGLQQMMEELSMMQLGFSPADAFAAKLLEDSESRAKAENIDVLCYASLAEGIRSVANSQMNHFFQMRRFEKESNVTSFNGISSEEIIDQLELDASLVLQYDKLLAQAAETSHKMPHMTMPDADISSLF